MISKHDFAEKLKEFLSIQHIPKEILAIYLYGSAVKGNLRLDSDWDTCVYYKR